MRLLHRAVQRRSAALMADSTAAVIPAPGSKLTNPLGLVQSSDGGMTLQPLGFAGESDFHTMGVGYRNHAIYLVNPDAITVHPDEPGTLALPTDAGLVQSTDYGDSFSPVGTPDPVTAAAYSLDGTRLLFGATGLSALDLARRIRPIRRCWLSPPWSATSFCRPMVGQAGSRSPITAAHRLPQRHVEVR
ncbi:MAG: hypothetical protein HC828_04100 [Blastochloris sp.]|nr:hypothetical protein [Blastochloris sp.]